MPGYLISAGSTAASIALVPSGNITANNLQDAIDQLDTNISSVEGIALIGL